MLMWVFVPCVGFYAQTAEKTKDQSCKGKLGLMRLRNIKWCLRQNYIIGDTEFTLSLKHPEQYGHPWAASWSQFSSSTGSSSHQCWAVITKRWKKKFKSEFTYIKSDTFIGLKKITVSTLKPRFNVTFWKKKIDVKFRVTYKCIHKTIKYWNPSPKSLAWQCQKRLYVGPKKGNESKIKKPMIKLLWENNCSLKK